MLQEKFIMFSQSIFLIAWSYFSLKSLMKNNHNVNTCGCASGLSWAELVIFLCVKLLEPLLSYLWPFDLLIFSILCLNLRLHFSSCVSDQMSVTHLPTSSCGLVSSCLLPLCPLSFQQLHLSPLFCFTLTHLHIQYRDHILSLCIILCVYFFFCLPCF